VYDRGNSGVYGERERVRGRKMMAIFRCVNEKRENRYWMEGEERRCRMCYEERETHTIEHVWNERKGERRGARRNPE
jgi:hypothetical protein